MRPYSVSCFRSSGSAGSRQAKILFVFNVLRFRLIVASNGIVTSARISRVNPRGQHAKAERLSGGIPEEITRALAKGHSRSQARGHPKAGEAFISKPAKAKPVKPPKGLKEPFALIDPKRPEEQAIKAMKKGASLKGGCGVRRGISQERLRKLPQGPDRSLL